MIHALFNLLCRYRQSAISVLTTILLVAAPTAALAAADLDINTPALAAVKASMQARHPQLLPYYQSGAIGFTADGYIAIKEASGVPLSQRNMVTSLVNQENNDRTQLYQGIAAANGHPEWAGEIQRTFAQRWMDKAQAGWFVQKDGQWLKK
ncbi:YdbL family protein [Methylophilus sp. YYY-1]|uniref:YdbL family protein n=1 Tax=Methylophilus sp. YYY-1 TaxID=2682087 RepID=UPI0023B20DAB|nr:YdbL family protein [Methylophilus sp. YYY-1]MDF0377309.1 DUF1318 domain-containing protein [Methylophilus sp. YYY-1]